jgi:hypothetical protein
VTPAAATFEGRRKDATTVIATNKITLEYLSTFGGLGVGYAERVYLKQVVTPPQRHVSPTKNDSPRKLN